jgi:DNA-binding transcriptional MerR regulator
MTQRWSIGEVASLFRLKTSTLRYWEDAGLLRPSGRRSGRRVYDWADLRRIALITTWRDTGLMELREIQVMLDGGSGTQTWRQAVQSRLEAIDRQRERLDTARGYLAHLATCPSDHPAATCPYLTRQVDEILAGFDDSPGLSPEAP